MQSQIYVRSFVRGPEQTNVAKSSVPISVATAQILRHLKLRLTPRVQRRTCRALLVFEFAVALLTTALPIVIFRASGPVVVCLLAVISGLALTVIGASLWLACGDYRRQQAAMRPRTVLSPLAFRFITNDQNQSIHRESQMALSEVDRDETYLQLEAVQPCNLEAGDLLLVEAGQFIHADGVVVEGTAIVDEAAITGESTGVIREAAGARDVMRDSLVVMGRLLVQVTARRGHPLDWIGGSASAHEHRTHNEEAIRHLVN